MKLTPFLFFPHNLLLYNIKQSKNFFSALDDSDDEAAPAPQKVDTTKKKEPTKQQKVVVPKKAPIIVEPSKSSSQPNQTKRHNHDRKHGGRGAPSSAAREGKRTFDRRSGTGRGKEIKKDGGGAHNWGSNKNLARSAQGMVLENNNNETTEEETKEEEEEEVTTTPVEEPPKEEEDNTLSYDEYMKQKARPENELFAPVKERQVENEFANLQPKVAVAEDFLVMEGTKGRKKKGVRNVEKKTLDVEFRVAASEKEHDRKPRRDDDRRGRGGRSSGDGRGRGGGGGGRGRGDGRGRGRAEGRGVRSAGGGGGQKGSTGINVNDSSAFPSL